jgi:hypothetical protein
MGTDLTPALEAAETAQNRAQAEQFSFDVESPGLVEVTNESHETRADHQYTDSIDDVINELMGCTCPLSTLKDCTQPRTVLL